MADVRLSIAEHKHVGFSTDVLSSLASRIIADIRPDLLRAGDVHVSVVWTDDNEIRGLNRQYRQKDEATDVLSFSYLEKDEPLAEGELGELVISLDTLKKQAASHNHDERTEAEILFVHGLLHLLGYDHEKPDGFDPMLALEKKYLGDKAGLVERSRPE